MSSHVTPDHDRLAELGDEQAALRRIATLVARGVPAAQIFDAVAEEVGLLLGVEAAGIQRFERHGYATLVGNWGSLRDVLPVGSRMSLEGPSAAALVHRTLRPARFEDYENATGPLAEEARNAGVSSTVGTPIFVNGRLWGAIIAGTSQGEPMPEDAESRIAQFTELVATAISNVEARSEVERLADEQAALRRVATLVAQDVRSSELFHAVAEEVGTLLGADYSGMIRYVDNTTVTPVATWAAVGKHPPVPSRWPVEAGDPTTMIADTGQPARVEDWAAVPGPIAAFIREELGVNSSVGSPIVVEGRLWGGLAVHSKRRGPLPPDTESRLGNFTELVATAIANTDARAEVQRLAAEQAALRRVATMVAQESSPEEVFAKVAQEVGPLLGAEIAAIFRYDPDGQTTAVGSWSKLDHSYRVGSRFSLDGDSLATLVHRTERPARIDRYEQASGQLGAEARKLGLRSGVGSPIFVSGRLWGALAAGTSRPEPLPLDAEWRIAQFTELVATAISNVQARADLAASRARIVAAADEERRRVVRDLHDGAQQRLVHTIVTLKLARRSLEQGRRDAAGLVDEALDQAETANEELRDLAHGILPSVLTDGGLGAAVTAFASRMSFPVELAISVDRLPAAVEATAYFIVAEALTNVAKHSGARRASVAVRLTDHILHVEVRDDGVGGALPDGTGLVGLSDRLAATDGTLRVESPAGGGTVITASIPVP